MAHTLYMYSSALKGIIRRPYGHDSVVRSMAGLIAAESKAEAIGQASIWQKEEADRSPEIEWSLIVPEVGPVDMELLKKQLDLCGYDLVNRTTTTTTDQRGAGSSSDDE